MNNREALVVGRKLVEAVAKYGKLEYVSYDMKLFAVLDTFDLCQIMAYLWREGVFDGIEDLCDMFAWIMRGASLAEIIWYMDGYSGIAHAKYNKDSASVVLETPEEM